jgi:hypothetical protein
MVTTGLRCVQLTKLVNEESCEYLHIMNPLGTRLVYTDVKPVTVWRISEGGHFLLAFTSLGIKAFGSAETGGPSELDAYWATTVRTNFEPLEQDMVVDLLAGDGYGVIVIRRAGEMYFASWGSALSNTRMDSGEEPGSGIQVVEIFPTSAVEAGDVDITNIAGSDQYVLALTDRGSVFVLSLGGSSSEINSWILLESLLESLSGHTFSQIAVSKSVAMLVDTNGALWQVALDPMPCPVNGASLEGPGLSPSMVWASSEPLWLA